MTHITTKITASIFIIIGIINFTGGIASLAFAGDITTISISIPIIIIGISLIKLKKWAYYAGLIIITPTLILQVISLILPPITYNVRLEAKSTLDKMIFIDNYFDNITGHGEKNYPGLIPPIVILALLILYKEDFQKDQTKL